MAVVVFPTPPFWFAMQSIRDTLANTRLGLKVTHAVDGPRITLRTLPSAHGQPAMWCEIVNRRTDNQEWQFA